MNAMTLGGGQAVLLYRDGDFVVKRPGHFVLCAVSGKRIPVANLRYWNPRTQEAYAGPEQALAAWKALNP